MFSLLASAALAQAPAATGPTSPAVPADVGSAPASPPPATDGVLPPAAPAPAAAAPTSAGTAAPAPSAAAAPGGSRAGASPALADPRLASAKATAPAPGGKPAWSELKPDQRAVLEPLRQDWDTLDTQRRMKWVEIATRYPSMTPADQQRLQAQMRDWARLTPDQRRVARETYLKAQKLPADQRRAQWEQYQALPDERKQELATQASKRPDPPRRPQNSLKLEPGKPG